MASLMNNSRPDKKRKIEQEKELYQEEKDIDTKEKDSEQDEIFSSLQQIEQGENRDVKDIIAVFENDIKHYDNAMRNFQNAHQKFKTKSIETVQKLRNILKNKDSKKEINLKTNQGSQEVQKQIEISKHDNIYQDNSNLQTINDGLTKPYLRFIESTSLPNSNYTKEDVLTDFSDCEAMSYTSDADSESTENEKYPTKQDQVLSNKSNYELRLQNAGKPNMAETNTPQIEIPKTYSGKKKVKIMADDTVCVFNDSSMLLYLIPKQGDARELKIDVSILDLACHPTQRQIMYCITPHETDIRKVDIENGSTTDLHVPVQDLDDLDAGPKQPTCLQCLALTKNGDLIVGSACNWIDVGSTRHAISIYRKKDTWVLIRSKFLSFAPLNLMVCETSQRIICFLGAHGVAFTEDLSMSHIYYPKCPNSVDGVVDSEGKILIARTKGNIISRYDMYNDVIIKDYPIQMEGHLISLCQDSDGNCYAGAVFSNKIIKIKF